MEGIYIAMRQLLQRGDVVIAMEPAAWVQPLGDASRKDDGAVHDGAVELVPCLAISCHGEIHGHSQ